MFMTHTQMVPDKYSKCNTNKWRHFSEKHHAFFPSMLHSEPREDTLIQKECCGFAQIIFILMWPYHIKAPRQHLQSAVKGGQQTCPL